MASPEPQTRIPKAELHLHIEGTLEPELAVELAERNRVALPCSDAAELRRRYRFHDLQSFLDVYYATTAVLKTEQDFADLAGAYLERARAQGVRHAEIFFDPQAHTERGVPMATVVEGLWSVLGTSERHHGISTALIMCFLRDRSPGAAMETLVAALPFGDRIVGVGLDWPRWGILRRSSSTSSTEPGRRGSAASPMPARRARRATCGRPSICSGCPGSTTGSVAWTTPR